MPDTTLHAIVLTALAALTSAVAAAQEVRWFRVELVVFGNEVVEQVEGATTPEQWDATPALGYPLATRFLIDPQRVRENAAEFDGESLVDEYGRQIITILMDPAGIGAGGMPGTRPLAPYIPAREEATATPTPAPVPPSPVFEGAAPVADAAEPVRAAQLPQPFVLLPASYQEFAGEVALMQRSGRYSILFHQTWVQPVGPEPDTIPIVLDRSGDTLEWPLLQGTIKLHLARYLHVQTNLWLNTAGEYLPGSWQMPAPPFGPPSLVIEEQEIIDLDAVMAAADVAQGAANDTATTAELESAVEADPQADTAPEPGTEELIEGELMEEEFIAEEAAPIYPYRHAVLLDQTRRMRSNELHYIDHPLLGVMIKFTPVTPEELDAIALEQAPDTGPVQQE